MSIYQKITVAMVGVLVAPSFVFATTEASTQTMEELQARIAELQALISSLQEQLKTAQNEVVQVQKELILTRSLYLGTSGEDVTDLQEWLSQFSDIYPEGMVTGYFGPLTEKAVKKYQEKYGIEQVGIVGPKTREHMKTKYKKSDDSLPYGIEKKSYDYSWKNDDDDDDDDKDDEYWNGKKTTICHNGVTINVAAASLKAHLKHGDSKGACGTSNDDGDDTTEDTTDPVISGLTATPTTTSATVVWTTDEFADSVVKYATTSPVLSAANIMVVEDATDVTSHSVELSGLTENTTYYFVVMSTDPSGNAASAEGSFVTTATPAVDETEPVITAVSSTVGSTTATVMWTTDELATSKVQYAISSPVLDAVEIFTAEDVTLTLSHSLELSGLLASTTYYFLPISVDGSDNTATGTEAMFTTHGE